MASESGGRRGGDGVIPCPPGDEFALTTRLARDDGHLTVVVEGELDLSNADQLSRLLEGELSRQRTVVLDLSGVRFIDSTGLAAIIRALRGHEDGRGMLRVGGELQPQARRLMELTGVLGMLEEDGSA